MRNHKRSFSAIFNRGTAALGLFGAIAAFGSRSAMAQSYVYATGDGYQEADGSTYYNDDGVPIGQWAVAQSTPITGDPSNSSADAVAEAGYGGVGGNASAEAVAANSTSDSNASASATANGGDSTFYTNDSGDGSPG